MVETPLYLGMDSGKSFHFHIEIIREFFEKIEVCDLLVDSGKKSLTNLVKDV